MKNIPKVIAILRGYDCEQINNIAEMILEADLGHEVALEITSNSPKAFQTIKELKKIYTKKLYIGAGTILNMAHAREAVYSGADFVLSPISLSKEILDYCNENDVVSVPGAFTPTEVYSLYQNGADIVKVFPATSLSNSFFKDIQAPLGDLNLMAVGGVNKNNAKRYLNNGVDYLGIGSAMFNEVDIVNNNRDNLKKSLSEFTDLI